MSDETPPPPVPPEAPAPPLPAAETQPGPPPVLRLTSAEDTYWIRHLGLPFFFRHKPSNWLSRAVIYPALLLTGGLLVLNLIIIPYVAGESIVDTPALTSQFYLLAIVLSCNLAPLFTTFSLSSERATGTMEFLRLAPLSPTAIVLGKTFAPVYLLHLVSLGFLTIGLLAGLPGVGSWTTFGGLVSGFVLIVCQALLAHALGAFMASLLTFFRGFSAILGFIVVSGVLQGGLFFAFVNPYARILAYFNPIGLMDGLYWHQMAWPRNTPTMIFDLKWLVMPYLVGMHLSLTLLLLRAAARRLDSSLRTALSPLGHMTLWVLLLISCFGIGLNEFKWGRAANGFEAASVLMGLLGLALIGLMIFDQPVRREVLLARACERISDGKQPDRSLRFLGHAALVAMLTLLTCIMAMVFLAFASPLGLDDWPWIALAIGFPPVLAVLCCLIMEANQVGFISVAARWAASLAGAALLVAIPLAATIDVAYTLDMWHDCVNAAGSHTQTPQNGWNYWERRYTELSQRYPERFDELSTPEQIKTTGEQLRSSPVPFFLLHHPFRTLFHLGLFGSFACAILVWRWFAYRRLVKEARLAVRVDV